MKRRYARNQALPEFLAISVREVLDAYGETSNRFRGLLHRLYESGWTLRAIGEATVPPMTPHKVYRLVTSVDTLSLPTDNSLEWHNQPSYKTLSDGRYPTVNPKSPGIDVPTQNRLSQLSELARGYRSGMSSTSPQSIANRELDALVMQLHENNVKIAEIAKACGVTHRAISKRIAKNANNH